MRRFLLLVLACGAMLTASRPGTVRSEEEPAASAPAFRVVDLWIEAGENRLAAWQVELRYDRERVKIVGLESGVRDVFGDAPRYDPKGLAGGRIVVAAFVVEDAKAPAGRVLAARLHLAVENTAGGGGETPRIDARLVTAAVPGGDRFDPAVEVRAAEGK
jgi:hypothetical protein